ncbi:MAG: hypothetical protein INF43_02150 [Alphaproteobacteria bacterium]|jgi:hypothetical protein|nr:hypothetical protein [Alphaproteobacteria bacterium]
MKLWWLLALVPLAACSSTPAKRNLSDAQCMGMASALQTLQRGDPLPRVQEVLGKPSRSYRVVSGLGRRADVLEYDTGRTPCASYLLDAPQKLVLQFDEQGGLKSYGRTKFLPVQGASTVRTGGVGGY